jgi:MFS family permease
LHALFDVKLLFIASVIFVEAGSALCGAAPTMNALIVTGVIAGVGGSRLYIRYEAIYSGTSGAQY